MKCDDKEWQHCRVEKMGCTGCYYDEKKRIVVRHIKGLEKQIMGRKNCIIYITYNCAKEINKMPIWKYDELMEQLKCRNIELRDEVRNE